jgi:hypothetical protein
VVAEDDGVGEGDVVVVVGLGVTGGQLGSPVLRLCVPVLAAEVLGLGEPTGGLGQVEVAEAEGVWLAGGLVGTGGGTGRFELTGGPVLLRCEGACELWCGAELESPAEVIC